RFPFSSPFGGTTALPSNAAPVTPALACNGNGAMTTPSFQIRSIHDERAALSVLQDNGVIDRVKMCFCTAQMTIRWSPNGHQPRWRCSRRGCRGEVWVRAGTWLDGNHCDNHLVIFLHAVRVPVGTSEAVK
ncbi:hypothetical protein M513_02745, partial [Trichuris suis]